MTISVAVNALLGIGLSVLYLSVVGYTWRFHKRWYVLLPIANAVVYVLPTANYINRMVLHGEVELRPLNWGVLLIVLPGLQIAAFLYWFVRDASKTVAVAEQAKVYTEEATQRAALRAVVEKKKESERKELAVERAADAQERTEVLTERTAAATERIADAAEAEQMDIERIANSSPLLKQDE